MEDDTNVVELKPEGPVNPPQMITIRYNENDTILEYSAIGYGIFIGEFMCVSRTPYAETQSDIVSMIPKANIHSVFQETIEQVN